MGRSIPTSGCCARVQNRDGDAACPRPDVHLASDKNRKVATLDMPNSKIGKVEVPIRPFFGTIGTAPAGK
jgi:acetamidase/formamidase